MNKRDSTLLENVWHELQAIREGQAAMAYVPRKLDVIDNRLRSVESDVKIIKLVVQAHSKDIADLKKAVA